ncbi:MAG: pyridoxamine 5'-phosphate oxidase family protein [Ignavibacteriae bacterium]|nr:pyridoxamine 5'-phosphate oxidase family protein [Ignavibacteriota bacterium]
MKWKNNFREGKKLILSTCPKSGKPNANIVVCLGFIDNKLLVADCQIKTTIKNLKENPRICVVSGYFRLLGRVRIYSSGKYFDICVKKNKGYKVKHAILISVKEVFDLEKVKKIL